ncbi:hypothetical protein BHM03_00043177 [Ensete ventricosum]|nr:hypothetical protein BHM03_00043177 [Ensete ventricosum]
MSTAAAVEASSMPRKRFSRLRGVRWRIDLGILPSSPSASIDDLRRVTADTRRRYASLRRRLLIDHHPPKDGHPSPDLTVDNPLSQNPGLLIFLSLLRGNSSYYNPLLVLVDISRHRFRCRVYSQIRQPPMVDNVEVG